MRKTDRRSHSVSSRWSLLQNYNTPPSILDASVRSMFGAQGACTATSSASPSHYAELARKYAPEVTKRIAEFEEAGNQPVMNFGKVLRVWLLDKDLAYYVENMHHSHVAVWEENRGGEMVFPARLLTLLAQMCDKGWNDDETLLALGREVVHVLRAPPLELIVMGRRMRHVSCIRSSQRVVRSLG